MNFVRHFLSLCSLACIVCGLFTSCGSTSESAPAPSPKRQTLNERFNTTKAQSGSYQQDSEGNWSSQNGKRSSFETQSASHLAGKSFNKKNFKSENFTKKSWWGNKNYAQKNYQNNTDASRFSKAAPQAKKMSYESSHEAYSRDKYETSNFTTQSANESRNEAINTRSSPSTDSKRKNFKQPAITHWESQRDIDIDQTKGMFSR